jgi:hypothetical protein
MNLSSLYKYPPTKIDDSVPPAWTYLNSMFYGIGGIRHLFRRHDGRLKYFDNNQVVKEYK